jgi:hypothetical protein
MQCLPGFRNYQSREFSFLKGEKSNERCPLQGRIIQAGEFVILKGGGFITTEKVCRPA